MNIFEAKRILRENGYLMEMLPQDNRNMYYLDILFNKEQYDEEVHVFRDLFSDALEDDNYNIPQTPMGCRVGEEENVFSLRFEYSDLPGFNEVENDSMDRFNQLKRKLEHLRDAKIPGSELRGNIDGIDPNKVFFEIEYYDTYLTLKVHIYHTSNRELYKQLYSFYKQNLRLAFVRAISRVTRIIDEM